MATSEKLLKAARENGKKGGRPKGKKTLRIMKREEALKHFRERTVKMTDVLFEAQLTIAKGLSFLFRIDKEFVKTGDGKEGPRGYYRAKKPVLVTSSEEMRQYLEDEIVNGDVDDEHDEAASYYYITAVPPSNMAIDSLMDRTHGRSKSELDVNINIPKPIYGGQSQLPAGKKALPPKKVKATIISADGKKEREVQEA